MPLNLLFTELATVIRLAVIVFFFLIWHPDVYNCHNNNNNNTTTTTTTTTTTNNNNNNNNNNNTNNKLLLKSEGYDPILCVTT